MSSHTKTDTCKIKCGKGYPLLPEGWLYLCYFCTEPTSEYFYRTTCGTVERIYRCRECKRHNFIIKSEYFDHIQRGQCLR
jgi:hypothetical protein